MNRPLTRLALLLLLAGLVACTDIVDAPDNFGIDAGGWGTNNDAEMTPGQGAPDADGPALDGEDPDAIDAGDGEESTGSVCGDGDCEPGEETVCPQDCDVSDPGDADADGTGTTAGDPDGADSSDGDEGPDGAGVDGGGPEPEPSCCEQLFCNAAFEECLATEDGEGCFCDPIYELCLFMGDNCPPGYNQPEPYICVDYGGQDGICRVGCEGPSIGMPDTCEGAEWLCGALPGKDGYCLPADCSGYFDNDFSACGPDATCLPTLDGGNVCVPDGPDDEGDTCGVHDECDHGLLCIDNFCSFGECSVDTLQVPCDQGITCLAWTVGVSELDVGNCAADCLVFTDAGCTDAEWCFPLANSPDGLPVDGYCVPSGGTSFEGMACDLDPNACVDGHMCVVSPDNDVATCEPLCTQSAPAEMPGACQPGRGCSPLFMVNEFGLVVEVMDYGSCIPACSPWVAHEESGCPATNWCEPMLFNSHAGECKGYFGGLPEGEPCNELTQPTSCGEGLFCLGFMTPMGMDGICHILCDVDGGVGATCAESQQCDELTFTGADEKEFSVAVGVCAPDPDWEEPPPEPEPDPEPPPDE